MRADRIRDGELQLLHRWLDSWTGVGLITVGVERQGYRLALSHIADAEWRATFTSDPMIFAYGVRGSLTLTWRAVQRAGWETLRNR